MTLALSSPERVKKLILADIAPVVHQGEREFEGYIKAMLEIEKAKVKTMREAMILLSRWEKVDLLCSDLGFPNLKQTQPEGHLHPDVPINKSRNPKPCSPSRKSSITRKVSNTTRYIS